MMIRKLKLRTIILVLAVFFTVTATGLIFTVAVTVKNTARTSIIVLSFNFLIIIQASRFFLI